MTTISPGIKRQTIAPVTWRALGYDDLVLDYIGDSTVTTGNRDDRVAIQNSMYVADYNIDVALLSRAPHGDSPTNIDYRYFGHNGIYNSSLSTEKGDDLVSASSFYIPFPRSTISLGPGNDSIDGFSKYSVPPFEVDDRYEFGYEESDNYIFLGSVLSAGDGDDSVYFGSSYDSVFHGGNGVDTIEFSGSRASWALEFDYKPDGSVKSVSTRNYNTIIGFEVFKFVPVQGA